MFGRLKKNDYICSMKKRMAWMLMLCCILMGCDKLEDSDAGVVREVLPGTWSFSYELQSEEEIGLSFAYDHVIFREDGTVSITYPGGSLEGTYKAGSAVIHIEGKIDESETRQMLWYILSFSEKMMKLEYKFDFNKQETTALVTLEKVQSSSSMSSRENTTE